MDSVSVLIAAYNAAPFLHRAVQSALAQTLPPLEILIVDDASTDSTLDTARKLAENDPRIRIIARKENGGPAAARNDGIDVACGDWIAILDADDAFLPERLERMIAAAQTENADVVVDNFLWYDAKTGHTGDAGIAVSPATEIVDIYRFAAQAMPYTSEMDWGLLKPIFRRQFLNEHRLRYPSHSRHGEDFLLMLSAFLAEAHYVLVRTPRYLYTNRQGGLSRTKIDYEGMAAQTVDLLIQDRVKSDKRLARILLKRIWSIQRLAAEHRLRQLLDRRDFKHIILRFPTDLRFSQAVFRVGWRKVRNLLGNGIKTTR